MALGNFHFARLALVAASISLAGWLSYASAGDEASVLVDTSDETFAVPQLAAPANAADDEALPPPSNPSREPAAKMPVEHAANQPFLRPAEPRRVPATTALSVKQESMPAPLDPSDIESGIIIESPEMEVRPAPPIHYDTDRDARRLYRKSGEAQVMMIAKNPADGCLYQIPMCIPGCCVGEEPKVVGGRGLLGRGVVEFCWECGFTAKVKFRHILGDVKVEYEGD